jgi:LemA protein
MAALLIVIIVGFVVVVGALVGVVLYNALVTSRNQVDNTWAQIDVQLKRRADLIPNLVETVKGYAAHERDTLEAVISARNAGVGAQGVAAAAQAEGMLQAALGKLFALAEAYPQLKADGNFRALQDELAGTENRVAGARQSYNDAVYRYNTKRETFPSLIVARMANFTARELFEAPAEAHEVPEIRF